MVGSHILKALLWYCRLLRDAGLDAAALLLLHTKWRNQEFVFRPLTVLAGNIAALPPKDAWPLLLHINGVLGDKASARLEKILKQVGMQQGLSEEELRSYGLVRAKPPTPSEVASSLPPMSKRNGGAASSGPGPSPFQYSGDYVGRYRGHIPSCTIRGIDDGALVELDYDRIPRAGRCSRSRPDGVREI